MRTCIRMSDKGKWPNGLASLMSARDDGPTALAKALNTSKQNVTRWRDGERKIPHDHAQRIADHYGVPITEVLFEDGAGQVSAPLLSWVSAGRLAVADDVSDLASAKRVQAADLNPGGDWIALIVDGDSMDRISPPDSIIFVDRSDQRLVPNACYVIQDADGGATYKRYRPNPDRWEPVSVNPDHEPLFIKSGNAPRVIGRVRRTMLDF